MLLNANAEECLSPTETKCGQEDLFPFAIETRHITKRFPKTNGYRELILHPLRYKKVTVIHEMNLQIKEGEVFCLLGPNGAGKTTLHKILCGLIIPNEGTALINGINSTSESQRIKKTINK